MRVLNIMLIALLACSLCKANMDLGIEEPEDSFDLILGGSLVASPGYQDYVDDAYESLGYDKTGGYGWIGLFAGGEYRPAAMFGIVAGCDFWFNGVDAVGGPVDETYANVIVIPSLYSQFYFTESRMFYINGGFSIPIPSTGSDYYEFENNGVGLGANIGVELMETLRIEGGFSYVPVKAKTTSINPLGPGEEEYNFGGVQLRILGAF